MSDKYEEAMLDPFHFSDDEIEFQLENQMWETKEGQLIPISKMTTEHIQSCLSFMKIRDIITDGWRLRFKPLLVAELIRREEYFE